jgi:putative chitinase
MTFQELAQCTGARIDRAKTFLPFIEAAMDEFDINTPARQASFLSQVGHESGGLHWLVEIWGPNIAQQNYEGRRDLGNYNTGDGYKFRGRGLLQITGRANYQQTGDALGINLISNPEQLGTPELAARSAAWFWKTHGLNELADAGDQTLVTRRINGGVNGLAERLALFDVAKEILNA